MLDYEVNDDLCWFCMDWIKYWYKGRIVVLEEVIMWDGERYDVGDVVMYWNNILFFIWVDERKLGLLFC